MPVSPTYPGVYIDEIPSGVHTITGVATSIAAFVGATERGPTDRPVHITSLADFQRTFGAVDTKWPVSVAVYQFYLNGGSEAEVVRLSTGAACEDRPTHGGAPRRVWSWRVGRLAAGPRRLRHR